MPKQPNMLRELRKLLKGKRVVVLNLDNNLRLQDVAGRCHNVHRVKDGYDLELAGRHCLLFSPEQITAQFVEGPLPTLAGGRRRIQIVSETVDA